jgi:hypothetical protein
LSGVLCPCTGGASLIKGVCAAMAVEATAVVFQARKLGFENSKIEGEYGR